MSERARRSGRADLGPRLLVAFVGVAVVAVGGLAGLTLLATRAEVSDLVARQRDRAAADVVTALEDAYQQAGSWEHADLRSVGMLAASVPASVDVRDANGRAVAPMGLRMTDMMARMHGGVDGPLGPAREFPLTVDGVQVGTTAVRFPAEGLPGPERQLRSALARTVAGGTAAATLLAAGVAWLVTRRLTHPLARLTEAARAFTDGNPAARAELDTNVGELAELSQAFDHLADTLARRERQRRALAADLSHELRTPVTILQGSVEQLLDHERQATRAQLTSLHDEVLRLGRLVDDLEALSSAEAAELAIQRRPVDLAAVTEEALAALRPQADAAALALQTVLSSVTVQGDAARLGQIVTNLVTNAIKYTPPFGAITVTVHRDGRHAQLRVEDSGPGIPDDETAHVFERFWRGPQTAGVGGSGIGLAVVAELTRAHDGTITVDSAPDEGATFTVTLPAG